MAETIEFYKLGKKLGLNKKDIDQVLNDMPPDFEHASFSIGPPFYGGGRYGTISLKIVSNKLKKI